MVALMTAGSAAAADDLHVMISAAFYQVYADWARRSSVQWPSPDHDARAVDGRLS